MVYTSLAPCATGSGPTPSCASKQARRKHPHPLHQTQQKQKQQKQQHSVLGKTTSPSAVKTSLLESCSSTHEDLVGLRVDVHHLTASVQREPRQHGPVSRKTFYPHIWVALIFLHRPEQSAREKGATRRTGGGMSHSRYRSKMFYFLFFPSHPTTAVGILFALFVPAPSPL